MFSGNAKQWILATVSAAVLMSSSFAAYAGSPHAKTNINLAVTSNFYGFPPSNSAITDLIGDSCLIEQYPWCGRLLRSLGYLRVCSTPHV